MRSAHRVPLAVFLILFFAYAFINQGWGWNQNSRLDLLHAIVVKHTVAIDAYEVNTGDKEKLNGHFYSEKAPGVAAMAMPAFFASYRLLSLAGVDIDGPTGWKISSWIATAGSVGLAAALGGMCLFLFLRKRIGDLAAFVSVIAVFLGSLPFPYATMMFSHGATMGLFAMALWLLDASSKPSPDASRIEYLLGFVCALAVAGEYPAAIAAAAFFAIVSLRGWRHAARFILGAVAPLMLIPGYNMLVSGSPLTLGYSNVDFAGMKEGFFGVTLPKTEAMIAILFSQFRGIFFWSPFLLLSIVGYPALYRHSRQLFWMTLFVPVAYFFFASSYAYWDGGFAFGPRHFATAVPFLAVPAAFGLLILPRMGGILAAASVVLTSFATFVNAMPPNEFHRPLTQFYIRDFLQGKVASNLGGLFGLPYNRGFIPWVLIVVSAITFLLWNLSSDARIAWNRTILYRGWFAPSRSRKTIRHRSGVMTTRLPAHFWGAVRRQGIIRSVLWILLIAGLALRFVHLPLMEFKEDEFSVVVSAYLQGHGLAFAQTALRSSLGLFNPPFFVWLLSIPAAFTADPVMITAFVTAINVAGMLLLYPFLRRAFSSDVALWTTSLLATAPWSIIYARKLWPQDVMILFLVLFYWSIWSLMQKHARPWHVCILFFSLAALTQLHLIALLIPIPLLLFFDAFHIRIRIRDACIGAGLFILLYLPYIVFLSHDSFRNLLEFAGGDRHLLTLQDTLEHFAWSVAATSGLTFWVHIGDQAFVTLIQTYFLAIPVAFFLVYAFGVAASSCSLIADAIRSRGNPLHAGPGHRILILMTVIYIMLMGTYIVIGAPPYTQYHIIFYPLVPLIFALGCEKAMRTRFIPSIAVRILILLIVIANLWYAGSFLHFLGRSPHMIDAGYGKPYALVSEEWQRRIQAAITGRQNTGR